MHQQVRRVYREAAAAPREHWWFTGRRRVLERVLRDLVMLPGHARVLDLGPGHGIHTALLRARGRLAALDLHADSLRACRAKGADDPVLADAAAPPFLDRSFDLVAALDVLEHLDEDAFALAEWRRILAPGGRLLLTVPALAALWGRQDVASGHRRRYSRSGLRQIVSAAGFEIERLSYFNTWLFLPTLAVRLAMRPFLRAATEGSDFDLRLPPWIEGLLARVLASEAAILARRDLPIGVSLLCLARPAGPVTTDLSGL